jgi:hypothetical protein
MADHPSGADTRKEINDDLTFLATRWAYRGFPGLGRLLQIIGQFYLHEREGYLIQLVNVGYDYAIQFGGFTRAPDSRRSPQRSADGADLPRHDQLAAAPRRQLRIKKRKLDHRR